MIWFTLAWRNFIRNTRKSYFTLLIIVVGTVACSIGIAYMSATFMLVKEGTIRGGAGHLQIASTDWFDGYEESTLQHGLSPDLVRSIEQISTAHPDIQLAMPRIRFQGLISHGDASLVFIGDAVHAKLERQLSQAFVSTVEGVGLEYLNAEQVYYVVIGSELARLLGVRPGDDITLMAVTVHGGINAVDATIAGISSSGNPDIDKMQLYAPLELAQSLLLTDKVSKFVLLLEDAQRIPSVQAELIASFPELTVRTWQELSPFYAQMVALYTRQFIVFGIIIGLVVALTTGNAMLMNLFERKQELATMSSMGLPERGIQASYLFESAFLGISAGALGLLLSVAACELINLASIDMPPPPGRSEGYTLFVLFDAFPSLLLWGAVILLCVLAAAFATNRINKLQLVEAING
ncbi:FtsX-like permease family protein [Alkalimonas collagenimarina]|uniref:FtsX-like permease family protein n=1 Tax=Alkalimonas collagenimarina TaxID=400390 RepID=A0ABT9GVY9_9GAMM|nr:FtsX-like permease family protein [Alkalimonas collagenimarina]MDP4535118.1 FtsX-like permease family protein [Alkalimonas collagenimarina]